MEDKKAICPVCKGSGVKETAVNQGGFYTLEDCDKCSGSGVVLAKDITPDSYEDKLDRIEKQLDKIIELLKMIYKDI